MRRAFLPVAALLLNLPGHEAGEFHWRRTVAPGRGCWIPRCVEGQFPLAVRPIEGPAGRLWMYEHSAVWSSADGIEWRRETADAAWGERYGAARVYALGKLWFIGGGATWARFENEVWSSRDGVRWVRVTDEAAWSPRRSAQLLEYQGRIWLLGGQESSGRPDQLPLRSYREVWSSSDGEHWNRVTDAAPWGGIECALAFRGRMWVISDGAAWHSSDGKTWTLGQPARLALGRRGAGCGVFRQAVWVFGGIGEGDTTSHDVWHSADGISWRRFELESPWTPRGADHSVVFANSIWIYGGKTGRADGYADDVWRLVPGSE
jgi:leucine-zipper-like transcriptional regulator 1